MGPTLTSLAPHPPPPTRRPCSDASPPLAQVRPPEKQLGVVLVLQVLIDEVGEQLLEDVGGVLQAALQPGHDERGHVAAIPHGEAALQLQGADEGQQEHLVVDELGKELQGLLHVLLPVALHLGWM